MSAELFCLHGFLGDATDWDHTLLGPAWRPHVHAFDWLARSGLTAPTWDALAQAVNEWAVGVPTRDTQPRRVLLGYSLGGRVAMHALVAAPALWAGAIIVAANPGLASDDERRRRLAQDRAWAERFRCDAWSKVMADWNAQPVFAGEAPPFARAESPEARTAAVAALELWSVANQRDLRGELRALRVPVLWVAGERDVKYAALMRECAALNPGFQFAQVPAAGHRVPWTRGQAGGAYFEKVVADWIADLPRQTPSQSP